MYHTLSLASSLSISLSISFSLFLSLQHLPLLYPSTPSTDHPACQSTSITKVTTKEKKRSWKEWKAEYLGTAEKKAPELDLRPNDDGGLHSFIYKGSTIHFYRRKGETLTVGYSRQPLKLESLNLSTWGRDNRKLLEIFEEAMEAKIKKDNEGVNIYVQSGGWMSGFELAFTRKPRASESVILDVDHADSLLQDARNFLSRSEW